MDWVYVWSPRYRIFHELLTAMTHDVSGFRMLPQFAEQRLFQPKQEGVHFLTGIPIKLYVIVNYIKRNPGSLFLFTDVDLLVFPTFSAADLLPYATNDITTMKECHESLIHNIGCMLIRCSETTLAFFERIASRTLHERLLDQDAFNLEVSSFPGSIGLFEESQFLQSNALTGDESSYKIIQCLTSKQNSTEILVEKLLTIESAIDLEPFLPFAPPDIQDVLRTEARISQP